VIRKDVKIVNKLGMHARAAAKFVTCAGSFASHVQLEREGRRVNGKSIMGVMMLAAAQGSTVVLLIDGEDEDAACVTLEKLVANRFGEDE
jgi:phosphocarrier protein HPr